MNTDERLQHYFTARSPEVVVPTVGADAIATRARRRHRRRTGVKVGAVAAVLALGGAVVAQGGDDGQQVDSGADVAVPSELAWTVVEPRRSLDGSIASATTDDGTVYELSTAPGRAREGQEVSRALYRTDDGLEWSEVALPAEVRPSSIAAGGDRIYAVGTSPAGGAAGEQVDLLSSAGGGWDRSSIPLDLDAEAEGFPGTVDVAGTTVARSGDTTVVAVTVSYQVAVDDLLPTEPGPDESAEAGPDGIDVHHHGCLDGTTAGSDPAGSPATATTAPPSTVDPEAAKRAEACEAGEVRPPTHHDWADLGVDPAVGAKAGARTELFVSTGGAPMARIASQRTLDAPIRELLGSPDGFWVVSSSFDEATSTQAVFSPDGSDWSAAPQALGDGSVLGAGSLAGGPAVATIGRDGFGLQLVRLGRGAAQVTDVGAQVGGGVEASGVAFGPMGFAATLNRKGGTGLRQVLAHTADGVTVSLVDLPPVGPDDTPSFATGLSVSADAIIVRLRSQAGLDGAPAPEPGDPLAPTYAFVGTPR